MLPEAFHVDHYKKAMKKLDDMKKQIEKEFGVGKENIKKEDITFTENKEEKKEDIASKIVIPGLTDKKPEVAKKKLMIMEMKQTPKFTITHLDSENQI